MSSESSNAKDRISIGRIPLKQVRVPRAEKTEKAENPMNRLVPYLDLFGRLGDAELSRLAGVDEDTCAGLRKQVVAICDGLAAYADLLPRLADRELVRLTGASDKTIRFWRLCQPREARAARAAPATASAPAPANKTTTGGHAAVAQTTGSHPVVQPGVPTTGAHPAVAQGAEAATADRDPVRAADSQSGAPQPTDQELMAFSGAPFPGFDQDDSAIPTPPPLDPLSMDEVEVGTDPLGLSAD